ncbi:MAG TPA: 30S ribosomal protein S20 [Bacteroidota bacterium]|nr:30S ribosomal protein S20 [Bacteroidota bacterium]
MAQHASAAKQARQAVKHREQNKKYVSLMKTTIRRVRQSKEKVAAQAALKRAYKLLDQLAAKGLIHRNRAANQKSALTKFVTALK